MGNKHTKSRNTSKIVAHNQPHQHGQQQPTLHQAGKEQATPPAIWERSHEKRKDARNHKGSANEAAPDPSIAANEAASAGGGNRPWKATANSSFPVRAGDQPSSTTHTPASDRANRHREEAATPIENPAVNAKTPVAVVSGKLEQQLDSRTRPGGSVESIAPIRAQPHRQEEEQQQNYEVTPGPSGTSARIDSEANATEGAARSNSSGSCNGIRNPLPLRVGVALASAAATDGYISFSESEGSEGPDSPSAAAPTANLTNGRTATAVALCSSEGKASRCSDTHTLSDGVVSREEGQQIEGQTKPSSNGTGGDSGDDKWDFGDGGSDDEREENIGGVEVSTSERVDRVPHNVGGDDNNAPQAQHQQSRPGTHGAPDAGCGSPTASFGDANKNGSVEEPQQSPIVVDRIGRRKNPPLRGSSSSSSEDDFDGWGDDDAHIPDANNGDHDDDCDEEEEEEEEEDEETDEDDDDGNVYDWTVMDTGEGSTTAGDLGGGGDDNGMEDSRRHSSRSTSERSNLQAAATSAAKPKAEANPLASKLGLSAGVPPSTMSPATIAIARLLQQQASGRGRGRGPSRGRGPKAGVPGRGGRPRYFPLMRQQQQQQGQPLHLRPQGPPSLDKSTRGSGESNSSGSSSGQSIHNKSHTAIVPGAANALHSKPPGSAKMAPSSPATGTLASNSSSSSSKSLPHFSSALGGARGGRGTGSTPPGGRSLNNGAPIGAAAAAAPVMPVTATTTPAAAPTTRCVTAGPSSPVAPPRIHRNNTSGGGGRGGGSGGGGGGAAASAGEGIGAVPTAAAATGSARGVGFAGARLATSAGVDVSAHAGGSTVTPSSSGGPPRGVVAGGRSDTAATVAGGGAGVAVPGVGLSKEQEAVKDTANITRKKAQLPQQEQLEHPTPVGGSWLKNRYIVNNYILLQPLGTGSYAEVRLAKEKTSNKLYAVKIMNKDFLKKRQVGKEETFMDSIKREIAIMKKVHHPNVLRLYEVMDDPKVNKLYLVLEYCKKGDLMNILNGDTRTVTCDPMNDTDVWYIMRQIVQGLSFLHLQNIIHGDIKPQNLLVGSDNVAKIADFGISKFVQGSNQRLQEQAGTPTFMSPELCCGEGYSGQLADVWALGATMYMIRCGKPPFMANQVMALYEKIQNDPLEFPTEVNMSAGLRRLLQAMMEKDPAKRITLDQVVSDRWLQQGDYGAGYARTTSTVGDTPTSTGPSSRPTTAPMTSTNRRPNTFAPPNRGTGAPTTALASAGSVGTGGFSAPQNHHATPGSGGGAAGHGLQPPPSLAFMPLAQQGYHAIKVSDDEVHKSITTTGSHSRSSSTVGGVLAASPGGGAGAGEGATGTRRQHPHHPGGPHPVQQQRAAPSARSTIPVAIPEDGVQSTAGATPHAVGDTEGGSSPPSKSLFGTGAAGVGGRKGSKSGRAQLSETEESWKSRSFKKKMEGNGSDPKFRGGTLPGADVQQELPDATGPHRVTVGRPPRPTTDTAAAARAAAAPPTTAVVGASVSPPPRSSPPAAHHRQHNKQQRQLPQQPVTLCSSGAAPGSTSDLFSNDEDDGESDDDFSEEDPDTLFEQDYSQSSPTASPRSATMSAGGGGYSSSPSSVLSGTGAPRRDAGRGSGGWKKGGNSPSGGDGGRVGGSPHGDGGSGGGISGRKQQAGGKFGLSKRRSSEKFDAVMDTLAAQPTSRLVHGGGNNDTGSSRHADHGPCGNGGGRSFSSPRPLRDLRLRGISVMSTPPKSVPLPSSAAAASSIPGRFNCVNRRLGLVAAASQRQGKRASQEDRVTVAADLAEALAGKVDRTYLYQQYGLFGVFDGHNGQMCSDALHTGLHVDVAKQQMFHQVPEKALIEAFNSFDKGLCARQEQEADTSGSTALTVLFDGRSRRLLIANVGDSRCVASMAGGVASRLSSDHRLSRPDERERVAARGGFVTNNRINGVLAISRSFGDVQHKDGVSPALIATPEVRSESVASSAGEAQLEFVVLATDGLWDVVEDQEAVNFVRLHLAENGGDLSGAATGLTKLALDQGSVDNVSAVLVWFDESVGEEAARQPQPQTQPYQQQQQHPRRLQ